MRPWGVKRVFRFPFRSREDVRADVDEEFAFHLDMRADELMRTGLDEATARVQAGHEFGNRASGAQACAREGDRVERRRRLARFAGDLKQDVTVGLRLLGKSPGFAAVAILTVALGIGANAAIFSVLDAVLLRPLPYPQPDRLLQVYETIENGSPNNVSGGAFLDWRRYQTQFDALTLMGRVTYNLRGRGLPERFRGLEVSHEFLQVFGIVPILGRGFLPDEDRPGGRNDVVLLTEELWRSRLGANPEIVGSTIILDEVPRTVIGVLPRRSWLFREDAFFVPVVLEPGKDRGRREPHWGVVAGRLKPGATAQRADAELKAIKRQLDPEYPAFKRGWRAGATPIKNVIAQFTAPALVILLAAVSLVLLIACANVANLLLARARTRQQEIAIRSALGAAGGRIVRQMLTESLTLATLGGTAGVAVAYAGVGLLRSFAGQVVPLDLLPELDVRVVGFAVLLTGLTGVLFGILPALGARRLDLVDTLNNGGKSATAAGRRRSQSLLIVAEVALTVVLLASAGLLLRSLVNTATSDPGFMPSRALAFDLSLPGATYASPDKRLAFSAELLTHLRALPGVDTAGTGMAVPFSGGGYGEYFNRSPAPPDNREAVLGRVDYISPGYLEALGARLLVGRLIADADNRAGGPRVAVISQTTVRTFFPRSNPIGEQIVIAGSAWQIVGVVADMADRRLDAARRPFAFVPQAFNSTLESVVVRTSRPPSVMIDDVRRALQRLDPGVALANTRTLDEAMAGSMLQRRIILGLIGTFAGAALALACIGLYGVMAYTVVTRRREICIRMALGAVRGHVVRQILGDGLRLMIAGLGLGIAGAIAAARLLSSELYEVGGTDPLVFAGTITAVVMVGLVACWMPAWRATRFNPIAALRND